MFDHLLPIDMNFRIILVSVIGIKKHKERKLPL